MRQLAPKASPEAAPALAPEAPPPEAAAIFGSAQLKCVLEIRPAKPADQHGVRQLASSRKVSPREFIETA